MSARPWATALPKFGPLHPGAKAIRQAGCLRICSKSLLATPCNVAHRTDVERDAQLSMHVDLSAAIRAATTDVAQALLDDMQRAADFAL